MSAPAEYKAYPIYQDSGIEWFGAIPQAWDTSLGKWLFEEIADRGHVNEPLLSVTQATGVLPRDASEIQVWNPGEDVSGYKLVLPDDFVISLRSFQGGIEHSACRGIISPAYTVLRPTQEINPGYFRYLLKSGPVISALNAVTTGIRQGKNISFDNFGSLPYIVPPRQEQRAIAKFLDSETGKIDGLVAKKKRLIELLQEKRTALIKEAVTKGLDPKVEMKDSGVEWLGEIPAHWGVVRLKRAVLFQRGHDLPSEVREAGSVPIISSAGPLATHSEARARGPGIVTGRYGTIGKFHLVEEDYWPLNTTLYSIEMYANEPRYLTYVLTSLSDLFLMYSLKSAVPGVDRNDIHTIPVAIAPLEEQQRIAVYLDDRMAEISALIVRIEDAVHTLNELRSALVSSAVTGKIDVREEPA